MRRETDSRVSSDTLMSILRTNTPNIILKILINVSRGFVKNSLLFYYITKIDNLPEEDLDALDPGALEVWVDLHDEGVRRHYRMVNAKYYPRADIGWAYTDFSTEEARIRYIEDYAYLDYDPGQLLTLATCVDAVGDYKAIIHCVPVGS